MLLLFALVSRNRTKTMSNAVNEYVSGMKGQEGIQQEQDYQEESDDDYEVKGITTPSTTIYNNKESSEKGKAILSNVASYADYRIVGEYHNYEDYVTNIYSNIVDYNEDDFNIYESTYLLYAVNYYCEETGYVGSFNVKKKETSYSSTAIVTVVSEDVELEIYFNIDTDEILIFVM